MDSVGNILAERQAERLPWGPGVALALLLHAAVLAGLLVSVLAKPMKYAPPRAVAVRLLRAGSLRAPEVRTAPAPPAPPAAAERPKIEKPIEEVPKPSEKAVLLPSKDDDKKKPTPPPISRPGKPAVATPAVNLPSSDEETPGTTAGPSAGAGGTAGIGGFKIDQADFKYPIYIDRMVAIMSMNWFKPAQVVQTNPVVHFQIQKDGTITDVALVTTSGLPFVDRAAMRAVYASSPLPPLPADYAGGHLGIQVVFE